jgi:hypothetical protein
MANLAIIPPLLPPSHFSQPLLPCGGGGGGKYHKKLSRAATN